MIAGIFVLAHHLRHDGRFLLGLGHSDRGGRPADGVGTADGLTFATMALCLAWLIRCLCGYDKDPVVRARVYVAAASLDRLAKWVKLPWMQTNKPISGLK